MSVFALYQKLFMSILRRLKIHITFMYTGYAHSVIHKTMIVSQIIVCEEFLGMFSSCRHEFLLGSPVSPQRFTHF